MDGGRAFAMFDIDLPTLAGPDKSKALNTARALAVRMRVNQNDSKTRSRHVQDR
jgi:hypothetical protein